jgi:hypothetical protein
MKNNLLTRIKTFIVLFLLLTSTIGFAQQNSDFVLLRDGTYKSVSEKNGDISKKNVQKSTKEYTPSADATFYEDFEAYDDWSISFGNWTLFDGNAPYPTTGLGIQIPETGEYLSYTFTDEGIPYAYIICNPSFVQMDGRTTTPFIDVHQAHSGSKMAMSINSWDGGFGKDRATLKADKWIITPKVTIGENDVFSFFAKSGSYYFPTEKYEVLVSTTDTDTASFTKIYTAETNDDAWRKQSFLLNDAGYANQDVYIAIRKVSNPAPALGSGDIFFVDDVEIYPAPTTPVAEIDSISWNAGYVLEGTEVSAVNYFTLKNVGLGKLTVNSITDLSGTDFSTNLVPADVNIGWQESLTFGFTYHPAKYGMDNETFVISTSGGDVTINLLGTSPQESFEGGVMPDAWKVINADGGTNKWKVSKGMPSSGEYSVNISVEGSAIQNNDLLVTPALNIVDGTEDVISYRIRENAIFYQDVQNWEVLLSTTGTEESDFTELLDVGVNYECVHSTPRTFEYNLDVYDGKVVYVAIRFKAKTDTYQIFLDDFILPELFIADNDLWAKELKGNFTPTSGIEKNYSFTVKNYGKLDQSSYIIQLVKDNDVAADEVLVTIPVNNILAAGAETIINIPYTFTTTEDINVYGKVILATDENTYNDKTESYSFSVLQEGHIATVVGDGDEARMILPTWPSQDNTLSEIIYMADDLDGIGLLTHIAYYNNFKSDAMLNEPVRIWVGETMRTSFNDNQGWIPSTEMTLVYDGTVTFPTGINEVEIALQVPYAYTGKNLVVMFERKGEASNDDNRFFGELTNYDDCSLNYNSEADPANPPVIGVDNIYINSEVPKTKFQFFTKTGKLEGTVTDINGNLEGVEVLVDESTFETSTLANGYYVFPYIFASTLDMTFKLHAYYDNHVAGIEVLENQTTVNDVVMLALPKINVNGYVTTTEFPTQGLEGANVKLEGYEEEYNTITAADGTFSMANVYGEKNYNVTISKNGYEIYTGSITVGAIDFTMNDVTLTETAYKIEFVQAIGDDESMNITWFDPNSGNDTTYAYEDGQYEWAISGEGHGNGNAWLGNKFPVTDVGVITGIDIFGYGSSSNTGEVSLDIFDANYNIIWTSEPFVMIPGEWLTVNVPEINYKGTFYAMVHWDITSVNANSLQLAVNENNNAMYYDPIQGFHQFSEMNGGYAGPFLIRAATKVYGKVAKYEPNKTQSLQASSDNIKQFTLKESKGVAPELSIKKEKSATRALESYKVYRGLVGADFATYTELTPTAISTKFYVDNDWANLEDGSYKFAVKGIYTNGIESIPTYSNIVNNGTPVQVTVNITTNEQDENNVEGAIFRLKNQNGISDYIYIDTVPANGSVNLTMAAGIYDIVVLHAGFEYYEAANIEIIEGSVVDVVLTEIINIPEDLFISNKNEGKADFSWNNNFDVIAESFEDDFGSGNTDWHWVDNDGDGFNWMIADATASFPTHSGRYAIGSQSYDPNSGTLTPDNYLITSAIKVGPNYKLSYWVAATDPTYFAEDYKVLVSTTGSEIKDFNTTLIDEQLTQNEAGIYRQRSLDLSAFAGQTIYIAWVHYGVDQWIMLLDDVEVGPDNSTKSFVNYEVYLNGVVQGSTAEPTMELSGLIPGTEYVAGVRSVYSSGKSDIATYNFTYIPNNANCTIKVSTNEIASSAVGAEITLVNTENNYTQTVPENREITMYVATGIYNLTVKQNGFEVYEKENVEIIDDINIDVVLIEKKSAPYNLSVSNGINGNVNFLWDIENNSKSLVGFKVYLDNAEVDITTNQSYQIEGLVDGIEYTLGVKAFYSTGESDIATIKHTYSETTGINDIDELSIIIYPNPVSDILHITNVKGGTIYIYNVIGNVVKVIKDAEEFNTIDVSSFVKGNYFVRVVIDNEVTVKKIGLVK